MVYVVSIAATAQNLLQGQLAALRARGFRVVLICSPGPGVVEFARGEGARCYPVTLTRGLLSARDVVSLLRIVLLLRRLRPDAVNVATPKAGFVAGLAAALARVPVRIYSLWGLRLEGEPRGGLRRRVLWLVERISCAVATSVLCAGPELRERAIEEELVTPARAVVLGRGSTNGVDLRHFAPPRPPERAAARDSLGVAPDAVVFGFVGRLTRDKGVATLVEAFTRVTARRPLTLLLVGPHDPTDPLPATVRRTVERDGRIVEAGFVRDALPLLHAMDVLVLPTRREGLPNVLLEAAASGLPVITTTATGCRDAVRGADSAVVVGVDDVDDLARAMAQLAGDEDRRRAMGIIARDHVAEHFDNTTVWDGVADFYTRELRARGRIDERWRRGREAGAERGGAA